MTYQVQVPAFEGPFDLLLHLISKHEVDIFEISISQLTEDYLSVLTEMKELDLEVATEFLLVAASLLEIKSGRLLPGSIVEDDDAFALSDRDLLIARLLQYRGFKDVSGWFRQHLDENAGFIGRAVGPTEEFQHLCPDILARVSLERFARIAVEVLTPRVEPTLDLSHLTPIGITIEEAIARVETALSSKEVVRFREVAGEDRMEVVVHFLAMLELIKAGTVTVEQAELLGDIEIRKREGSQS
ncbi:MAG: segregation and condensation protein A [Actinomycetota bacterium]